MATQKDHPFVKHFKIDEPSGRSPIKMCMYKDDEDQNVMVEITMESTEEKNAKEYADEESMLQALAFMIKSTYRTVCDHTPIDYDSLEHVLIEMVHRGKRRYLENIEKSKH